MALEYHDKIEFRSQLSIGYGVMVNIGRSHRPAPGSIPGIRILFCVSGLSVFLQLEPYGSHLKPYVSFFLIRCGGGVAI